MFRLSLQTLLIFLLAGLGVFLLIGAWFAYQAAQFKNHPTVVVPDSIVLDK
jgi:hypothetical protein